MKSHVPDNCGLTIALLAIGGKWKPTILWEVTIQPLRFGELRRQIGGISEKVLTQQLREMEADGLIHRVDLSGSRRHVEYSASEIGLSLNEAIAVLSAWGKLQEARLADRDVKPRERLITDSIADKKPCGPWMHDVLLDC